MISVIIPVYNTPVDFLERCFSSISFPDGLLHEVIVVDDGSDSEVGAYCRNYCETHELFHYFYQTNQGVSAARNAGIRYANGNYVMFVDADDQLLPGVITSELLREQWDFFVFDMQVCENGKDRVSKVMDVEDLVPLHKKDVLKEACSNSLNSACAKLYKCEMLKEHNVRFDDTMVAAEDAKFVLDVIIVSQKIGYLSKPAYRYIYTSSSGDKRLMRFSERVVRNSVQLYTYRRNVLAQWERWGLQKIEADSLNAMVAELLTRDVFEAIGSLLILAVPCDRIKKMALPIVNDAVNTYGKSFSVRTRLKGMLLLHNMNWLMEIYAQLREWYIRTK